MHTEALVNAAFWLENKQRKLVRQNEAQTEIQHILNKYKYSLDFFQSEFPQQIVCFLSYRPS